MKFLYSIRLLEVLILIGYVENFSIHHEPPMVNTITAINTTCDTSGLNVTITMDQPFKGTVFAKDFYHGCRSFGTMKKDLFLNLPSSGCGVRLFSNSAEDDRMSYGVNLVIQQDKHLRQFTDQEKYVQCDVDSSMFKVRSKKMEDVVKKEVFKNTRIGRMKDEGWSKSTPKNELEEVLGASRAWMEIIPLNEKTSNEGMLQVGEETLLMVKSTLPDGIGWKVVDCLAHDGLGDSSQKLLDENGCPIDELLMPEPVKGPIKKVSMMRYQEAVSKFAAFKFPDRDRLHLTCGLQLCKGKCERIDCSSANKTESRISRQLAKGAEGEVLERFEVYNSVEVLAPGIELEDPRQNVRTEHDLLRATFGHIPGDRPFCVSPDKMALTFCVLGLIFLCAVVVAALALYKARKSGVAMPYYTRSVFSSSSGSGSAYGSKLLLHESPCMGHSASIRGYGRIL